MATERLWRRQSKRQVTFKQRAVFHLVMTGVALLCALANYLLLFMSPELLDGVPLFLTLPTYIGIAMLGEQLLMKSRKELVSLSGTLLIASPLGLVSYRCFGGEVDVLVLQLLLPLICTISVLGALNTLTALLSLPKHSVTALSIVTGVLCTLMMSEGLGLPWVYWLLLLIALGRLGRYWERARALTCTADNAIDVIGALVIDSLNPLYYLRVGRAYKLRGY